MEWTRCVDLSVILPNEPGALSRLLGTAKSAGVEVEGACGFLWGSHPVVHVLVNEADSRDTLEESGFDVRAEAEVLVIPGGPPPDIMARVTAQLSDAGVNVDICYLTNDGAVVVGVDDFHKAQAVIELDQD